jgi:hypothetical protein
MFPSETAPLADVVGLGAGETVLWLYVGSAEDAGDAGPAGPAPVEGAGNAPAGPAPVEGAGNAPAGPVPVEGVGDAGPAGPVPVEGAGDAGAVEDDPPARDETAEWFPPEVQAVVNEAHRTATTAATRRPRHMWARRTIGGTGGVRTGLVLLQMSSIVLLMTDPPLAMRHLAGPQRWPPAYGRCTTSIPHAEIVCLKIF